MVIARPVLRPVTVTEISRPSLTTLAKSLSAMRFSSRELSNATWANSPPSFVLQPQCQEASAGCWQRLRFWHRRDCRRSYEAVKDSIGSGIESRDLAGIIHASDLRDFHASITELLGRIVHKVYCPALVLYKKSCWLVVESP